MLSMASMSGTPALGGGRQGISGVGAGGTVGRGAEAAASILTVPLFEAVLPNCYLVLGLKQRSPSRGLSARLPTLTPPWGNSTRRPRRWQGAGAPACPFPCS